MTMEFVLLPDDRDTLRSAQRSAQIKQLWDYVGAFWRVTAIRLNDEKQHGCHIITCDLIISKDDRASIYNTYDRFRGQWLDDRMRLPILYGATAEYNPNAYVPEAELRRAYWEYERVRLIHNNTGKRMYAIKCNGIFVDPKEFRTNPP